MTAIVLAAYGRITTRFGQDIGRGFPHRGIDQGHGNGRAADLVIVAPADGVVTAAGKEGTYGLRLKIQHPDGWTSLLAHHSAHHVRVGQQVTRGQHVATMGNSGTVFVHSHQELRNASGVQLDPLAHLYTAQSQLAASTAGEIILPKQKKGATVPDLFHLQTSKGDQAYIVQSLASQQAVSWNYIAALSKGFDQPIVVVNEFDWAAITAVFTADQAALARLIGTPAAAVTTGATAEQIAQATVFELARELND
jgi:hypothetical protein